MSFPNLLDNFTNTVITTDGNKSSFHIKFVPGRINEGTWTVWGTFNGATVQLQDSPDNIKFFDVPSGSLTAEGQLVIRSPQSYLRVVVSGAGGSTSLNSNFS
jgi:hypothetical protein